jgi:hypothetical protein
LQITTHYDTIVWLSKSITNFNILHALSTVGAISAAAGDDDQGRRTNQSVPAPTLTFYKFLQLDFSTD